ncbi:hypothetical protein MLD38_017013 [Melastoma candidum]|uniref:Uncharacterized protein n=1 Tax=Melastoma candidum TaxID=119954 RepID=A0ACB9QNM5_9MYRT|nr:hypothetical protein MLD38_017013 [Melastoma candidum]
MRKKERIGEGTGKSPNPTPPSSPTPPHKDQTFLPAHTPRKSPLSFPRWNGRPIVSSDRDIGRKLGGGRGEVEMTSDSTSLSYWLNITFFLSALCVLVPMALASILIWKFEGPRKSRHDAEERQWNKAGCVGEDELWRTCLKSINPVWLLGYRVFSFVVLLSVISTNVFVDGIGVFYFYTQWTFALVTAYFGIGSWLSINGFVRSSGRTSCRIDRERRLYEAAPLQERLDMNDVPKSSTSIEKSCNRLSAGVWGYIFQIVYQMSGGAVMLTDSVFWIILYPFLTSKDYHLNTMDVCLHSINAFFLLGDTFLNNMHFPMFRFAYFVMWTGIYVIFQWIIHAFVSMWWPYPFLDLSTPYAPLWYLGVALMHIPCYGFFALINRAKRYWLSRSFPGLFVSVN